MENTTSEKKNTWEKIALFCLLAFGFVLLVLILLKLSGTSSPNMVKQESHSDLINTKEIATLSVSEFVYNGIAQVMKDDGNRDYNVLYKSTVKVSVDANNINYKIDEEQRTVTFSFPEISIEKPVIDVGSLSVIPEKNQLYMDDIIALCRDDALKKAQKSEKLVSSAQENIRSIIEAWYSPVFQGYTFEYQFDTSEGGEVE